VPTALYRRAMVRSACPDAKLRDGKKALADATRLNSLLGKDDASAIECLAAARAEVGQFDEAVKLQTRLLERVRKRLRGGFIVLQASRLHRVQLQAGRLHHHKTRHHFRTRSIRR
jgi:hypothetical protein